MMSTLIHTQKLQLGHLPGVQRKTSMSRSAKDIKTVALGGFNLNKETLVLHRTIQRVFRCLQTSPKPWDG